jgi:broad specificity phosphatase PhoE
LAYHRALDILLMRHGLPDYPPQTYPDPFKMPLSGQGRTEAQAGARAVERFQPDLACSSDFLRARQTAELATASTGLNVRMTGELRERVFYSLAGKTFARITQEHGQAGHEITKGNSDLLDLPGEETYKEAKTRVVTFFQQLARQAPGTRVLAVCHGGPHAWLLEEALNADLRGTRNVALQTGHFSRFTLLDGRLKVESVNLPPAGVIPPSAQ